MKLSLVDLIRLLTVLVAFFPIQGFSQNTKIHCLHVFEAQKSSDRAVLDHSFATYEEAIQGMSNIKVQIVEKIENMTFSELTKEVQNSINELLKTQTYLPGCTPQWTVNRVEDLVVNFYSSSNRATSMLHQISSNLGAVEMISDILKSKSGIIPEKHRDLIQLWNADVWHYHVFRVFENRLSQSSRSGLRFRSAL